MKKETLTKILAATAASFVLTTAVYTTAAATSAATEAVQTEQSAEQLGAGPYGYFH